MGGKDAIIVDADADSTPPSKAWRRPHSASRARSARPARAPSSTSASTTSSSSNSKARVEKITVGDPAENANMGAVINEGSMKTILDYIEKGKKDGRLITGGGRATEAGEGYFIQPTVIADIAPEVEARAGRDLRPGAGGDQGAATSTTRWRSPTTPSTA